jgi:pantetheine-phosphate adenylyltransferase
MPRIALFPGSFDPVTNGHLDLVRKAAGLADRLVIAVGTHPGKSPLFSVDDRLAMLREVCVPIGRDSGVDVHCTTFDDLVVSAANRVGATILIRGLRSAADFDYEIGMAGMNHVMAPGVQTVFLPASSMVRPITATLVRQIAAMGGDVSPFVPPQVLARLKSKLSG